MVDTIVVILILLAIIVEIFLGWRWHKEIMRDKEDKAKEKEKE